MEEEIDIGFVSFLEMRLRRSVIDHERKAYLGSRLIYSQDVNELKTILKEVELNQPIMGLEIIPQGQGSELVEAIQNRVDRDDFYERKRS